MAEDAVETKGDDQPPQQDDSENNDAAAIAAIVEGMETAATDSNAAAIAAIVEGMVTAATDSRDLREEESEKQDGEVLAEEKSEQPAQGESGADGSSQDQLAAAAATAADAAAEEQNSESKVAAQGPDAESRESPREDVSKSLEPKLENSQEEGPEGQKPEETKEEDQQASIEKFTPLPPAAVVCEEASKPEEPPAVVVCEEASKPDEMTFSFLPALEVLSGGLLAVGSTPGGDELSLEVLTALAAESAVAVASGAMPRVAGRPVGVPVPAGKVPPAGASSASRPGATCWPCPPGAVTNGKFICYVDSTGTAVQVVVQATMSPVASLSSEGARVVDFALQTEESLLLTAFDNGRVTFFRLTAERATPKIMLQFEANAQPQAVLWHPINSRVFLTLHPQRVLLWHLQLIVQFSSMRILGYQSIEGVEGVPTALKVTDALAENAACEALPLLVAAGSPAAGPQKLQQLLLGAAFGASTKPREVVDSLLRMALTPDGQFLLASSDKVLWLWKLAIKDEQTAPVPSCLQKRELPEDLRGGSVVHMRLAPRYTGNDASMFYILLLATRNEVVLFTLDPRPSGGTGYWLPMGRLICPLHQRLRFPCLVSADIFVPGDENEWPHATLVVSVEGMGEDAKPLLLAADISHAVQEAGKPPVALLVAVEVPSSTGCSQFAALRAFERSARARAIPETAEVHCWAVAGISSGPGAFSCWCLALPRPPPTPFPTPHVGPIEYQEQLHPEFPGALPAGVLDAFPSLPNGHQEAWEASEAEPSAEPASGPGPGPVPGQEGQEGQEDQEEGQESEKKAVPLETDKVTVAMVHNLSFFLQKRAQRASDGLVESVLEKLPNAVGG
ncbi:unnamed protein product, partial [Polarella glacialis]